MKPIPAAAAVEAISAITGARRPVVFVVESKREIAALNFADPFGRKWQLGERYYIVTTAEGYSYPFSVQN
jgi:hypothetical protein